jgi:hypothetical protein
MSKRFLAGIVATMLLSSPTKADQAVKIGNAYALLNKATGATAGVILVPGGDGQMGIAADGSFSALRGNQLVRTRKAYAAQGVSSLTIDRGVSLASAIAYMRGHAKRVVVVATSRGSLRVPGALGAKPDGLVLTAAFLGDVRSAVGSPGRLPSTLVVHHRQDGCRHTPPTAVAPFAAWGGSKVKVAWLDGGSNEGNPCQARGYHGFAGRDGAVVSRISSFAKSGS